MILYNHYRSFNCQLTHFLFSSRPLLYQFSRMSDDLFDVFNAKTVEQHWPEENGKSSEQTTEVKEPSARKRKASDEDNEKKNAIEISDEEDAQQNPPEASKEQDLDAWMSSMLESGDNDKKNDDESKEDNVTADQSKNMLSDDVVKMPSISIHKIDAPESCTHEVAMPPGMEFTGLIPPPADHVPAKEFPFVLDPFQKEAVLCLENNRSVLVSAHTSAGKTVVAIHAIAMCLKAKQRVIYTSPIKALSNQKYRELYEEFGDVGLMTGDATINPSASCLVLTTEILRSMLYRGSEVIREVAWVVFDEIHYMRDKERGVVWEESIILLPDSVRMVFLSATIPNARQFAEWVCHTHKQPCHVVYTDYRPTPLQHYVFPAGGEGIFLVVDENGTFKEDNFAKALTSLASMGEQATPDNRSRGRKGGPPPQGSNCFRLVKMIVQRQLAPVIIFSFARRDCESYALEANKLDFNTADEKKLVQQVFDNAVDTLSEEDRELPQIKHVLPLLMRGIGIHHSGLLPLLKETIEILFQEGLIKALFATETFSMGLNMPARTVLFTQTTKFDGKEFRWITSGEYIQMSGRAGRRGIDKRGIVILMIDERISPAIAKQVIKGQADPLNSAFKLTYNMVLNLLRVEGVNPEFMMERSFFQFQNYSKLPALYEEVQRLQKQFDGFNLGSDEESVASYYNIRLQLEALRRDFAAVIRRPVFCIPYMQPGRVVHIQDGPSDLGWCAVVNFTKKKERNFGGDSASSLITPPHRAYTTTVSDAGAEQYILDVLMKVSKESLASKDSSQIKPLGRQDPSSSSSIAGLSSWAIVPVSLTLMDQIAAVRIYLPKEMRTIESKASAGKSIEELQRRFKFVVPVLDPVDEMQINDPDFKQIVARIASLEERLKEHPLQGSTDKLKPLLEKYTAKMDLQDKIKFTRADLRKRCSLLHLTELKNMKRVLRRLGYCSNADVVQVKGRVACEISAADELVLTELLFNGVFNELSPAQCASLLSCMVFEEKSKTNETAGSEVLARSLRVLQDTARRIATLRRECNLEVDENTYVESFKPFLMKVVESWCEGASFSKLCEMTDVFEGSVIRCMRRLEESLREMIAASKAIGNTDLEVKFSDAIKLLKRDIVFAASLYL